MPRVLHCRASARRFRRARSRIVSTRRFWAAGSSSFFSSQPRHRHRVRLVDEVGLRGEGVEGLEVAGDGAELRLPHQDADDDGAVDAGLGLGGREHRLARPGEREPRRPPARASGRAPSGRGGPSAAWRSSRARRWPPSCRRRRARRADRRGAPSPRRRLSGVSPTPPSEARGAQRSFTSASRRALPGASFCDSLQLAVPASALALGARPPSAAKAGRQGRTTKSDNATKRGTGATVGGEAPDRRDRRPLAPRPFGGK